MNNQLEQLIADLCDADKRNADPELQKASEIICVNLAAEWYVTITQK